jgi:hypothetical protein
MGWSRGKGEKRGGLRIQVHTGEKTDTDAPVTPLLFICRKWIF